MDKLLESAKAVAAAVGSLVTLVAAAVADKAISFDEAGAIAAGVGVVLTSLAVWRTPNKATA